MNDLVLLVLLAHAAATFYLVGVIWLVQRVHYPLFARVGAGPFRDYQRAHLSRITPVVAPPMLIEAGTGLLLLASSPPHVPMALAWLGLGLLGVVWSSTFLLQVPRHAALEFGFDEAAHRQLVATNWIRTAAWSLRGILVLWMLFLAMGGGSS